MIDVGTTALVPMDLVNDLVDPRGVFGSVGLAERLRQAGTIDNIARAMSAARRKGVRVVHVRLAWRPGHVDLNPHVPLLVPGISRNAIVDGTWGSELHAAVDPAEGEVVVTKAGISAFAGTDLHRILTLGRITTLVLGGFATNWVVESTARDAVDFGYRVVVLADCCLGYDDDDHRFAIERTLPMLGSLMTSSAFVAGLDARPKDLDHRDGTAATIVGEFVGDSTSAERPLSLSQKPRH